jgi:long-chain fatty acid transport protein
MKSSALTGPHFIAVLLTLCVGSILPSHATASPFDVQGSGQDESALGLSGAASAEHTGALHLNPATLRGAQELSWSVGLSSLLNYSEILLMERPEGYDVPDLGADSPALATDKGSARSDTQGSDPLHALTLSAMGSPRIAPNLSIGASFFLPLQSALVMRTHFVDERDRYDDNSLELELLSSRLRRFDAQVGASYHTSKRVDFGASLTIAPTAGLSNTITLEDAANQENAQINLQADTGANLGWNLGVRITPHPGLHVGVAHRSPVFIELTGENAIFVQGTQDAEGNPQQLVQTFSFVPSYTPARTTMALAWHWKSALINLDAHYTRWSDYIDTQGATPGFRDTFSASLGAKVEVSTAHHVMLGASYIPSPVPEQTARTNYVDNDRLMGSLGAEHQLLPHFALGWFTQVHWLRPRTHHKQVRDVYPDCRDDPRGLCDEVPDDTADGRSGTPYPEAEGLQTGNPGFPGFSSGGFLIAAGVRARFGAAVTSE